MRRLPIFAACAASLALLAGGASAQQKVDLGRQQVRTPAIVEASAPHLSPPPALSGSELGRRLKMLDKSIPDVVAAGNSVTLGPGALAVGRTEIEIRFPMFVSAYHGTPVADFFMNEMRASAGVRFDAQERAQYAIDFVLGGNDRPDPGGSFEIRVHVEGNHRPVSRATLAAPADGHLLYSFTAPASARMSVNLARLSAGPSNWRLFRAELIRIR